MNKLKTITITVIITALLLALAALVYFSETQIPFVGSAPTGASANTGSSSLVTIPSQTSVQIFATSTCVARVIGRASTSPMLTLTDSQTNPSGGFGVHNNASTSVTYDSGVYGCGLWRAFNTSDTQVIFTITEFVGFN